jgi:hypothetical protein
MIVTKRRNNAQYYYQWQAEERQEINHHARGLYKKAYLLEFMDENGKEAAASFTFSVPPESEELAYPQRKTETKTFGGLHVDDYGIDAVKISLSGSTVNQELKLIYDSKSPGNEDKKTGEREIYLLRDLLKEWKSGKNLNQNKTQRIIMLYDLSKMNDKSGGGIIKNYWRVFPGELKIRRSSEKPFTYKYSIDFTGVDPEIDRNPAEYFQDEQKIEEAGSKLNDFEETVIELKNALANIIDLMDDLMGKINKLLKYANELKGLINTLGNIMKYGASMIGGVINAAGETAAGLVDSVTNVAEGVHAIVSLPRTVELAAANAGLEVFNAAKNLARETAAMVDECRKMFDPDSGYWDIPRETLNQFGMTSAEFKGAIAVICDTVENTANEMAAAAKSAVVPDMGPEELGPEPGYSNRAPGDSGGAARARRRLVLFYGDSEAALKQTDTLESLAGQYYGNPGYALYIAAYNRIASIDELSPGDTIKIPVLTKSRRNAKNRIYARPGDRDNYGRDIALNDNGGIPASPGGDYKLTDGVNNLTQAVLLRLRERVNKRIRLNAYGIRTNISDPNAGIAYILSSIDLTMRGEPRVKAVKNIGFTGQGDSLNVNVDYTDINNAGGTVRGRA